MKVSFSVERSIVIQADKAKVFNSITNFKEWKQWSPWLIADPECVVNYSADGTEYSWDGKIAGAGRMIETKRVINESVDCDLIFTRPFKSHNTTGMKVRDTPDGTELSWNMVGTLPIFFFFMKDMFAKFVGSDYDRGLKMLKEFLETGKVNSRLTFPGVQKYSGSTFIGLNQSTSIAEIGPSMEQAFASLHEYIGKTGNIQPKGAASIYHKWNLKAGTCEYTAAILVDGQPAETSGEFISGQIPEIAGYKVVHTGSYSHLGNAWAAGMSHSRSRIFKSSQSHPPFEIYENDPNSTPSEELVTSIYFPVKG